MLLDREIVRTIQATLSAIRADITDFANVLSADMSSERLLRGVVLQIEGIRSKFMSMSSTVSLKNENFAKKLISDLRTGLEIIASNIGFMDIATNIPFSIPESSAGRILSNSVKSDIYDGSQSLHDVILNLMSFANNLSYQPSLFDDNTTVTDISALRKFVPEQKVGPIQLEVKNNRLSIAPQSIAPAAIDAENVRSSRSDITKRGESLIKELRASNNDPRLIAEIEKINKSIASSDNIIEIGVANIGCGMMGSALKGEMAPALSAMLSTYTMSIDMYVAQFPDWNRFAEQAALVQLDSGDISQIRGAAFTAVERLEDRVDIVDPEVPRTFRALLRLIDDPSKSSKRAAFAVLRSIENLISKAVSFAGDLADKTKQKSIDKLSGIISSALVAGLLTIAVSASSGVAPIASKINELQWLKNAIEVVQEHLSKIKAGSE